MPSKPNVFERNSGSEQVDHEGNAYNEEGALVREKPSDELLEAMRLVQLNHKDEPDFEVRANDEEVQQVLEVIKRRKKNI